MADVVDAAHTGAQAPPVSKAAPPQPIVAPSSVDDTPTEPATSPRMIDPQAREWPLELQLPAREIGPREEPVTSRNAQFQRSIALRRSSSSRTCSGSRRLLVLIEGHLRILDCIAHTVT